MEKILALLADIKGFFTGANAKLEKLTLAEDRVKALEGQLTVAQAAIADRDTKITALTGELATAKGDVTAKAAKITELEGKVAEEKKTAMNVISAQGVPIDQLPAAETSTDGGVKAESAFATYSRLMAEGKSVEAAAFYAKRGDEIFKSR